MLAREAKAAAYRSRALEASDLAEASTLDRVREKHQLAAARWRALAAFNERAPGAVAPPPAAGQALRKPVRDREEVPCIG